MLIMRKSKKTATAKMGLDVLHENFDGRKLINVKARDLLPFAWEMVVC